MHWRVVFVAAPAAWAILHCPKDTLEPAVKQPSLSIKLVESSAGADVPLAPLPANFTGPSVELAESSTETFWVPYDPLAPLPGNCTGTVWWLHIPKTGSSFEVSARRCRWTEGRSRLKGPIESHQILPRNVSDDVLRTVVSMFREPKERLVSSYYYIRKDKWCCNRDWGWDETISDGVKKEVSWGLAPSVVFSDARGCYSNMISGRRGCMTGLPHPGEIEEAVRRVILFRFVGLTSQWRLSMCLFNFVTEGRRFVTEAQLLNSRPTLGEGFTSYNTSGMPEDDGDALIYAIVFNRFWSEVREYNITDQNCPME